MARIDKYDPVDGGFRAPLAAAWTASETPIGVGLNVNGRVVPGAGVTGIKGVVALPKKYRAGDVVDVMTDGELVEFAGAAATNYYAAVATGVISTTAAGGVLLGHTVEATRLVVRVADSVAVA